MDTPVTAPLPILPTPAALTVIPSLRPQALAVVGPGDPAPTTPHIRIASAHRGSVQRIATTLALEVAPGEATFAKALIDAFATPPGHPVAAAAASCDLLALATRIAAREATVLIEGPTGAGKEGLARLIHFQSPRRDFPLVAVNCAALPETMLEATLFGHERGAFTGALSAGKGLFRAAHGGTLLLDEVAELPLALQAKLLRAVQEREVLPIGATRPEPVDVRIIACANRDLAGEVEAGRFRSDLFYRLAVFPLRMTRLAERRDDIAVIAAALLLRGSPGAAVPWLTAAALARLQSHDWPGNARELANVIERARILADDERIETGHIVFDRLPGTTAAAPLQPVVRQHEDRVIRAALAEAPDRRAAASRLGISERTLRYKLAAMTARANRPLAAALQ